MVTVADIIALPAFHAVEVLAGGPDSLARPVVNVGIMDTLPGKDAYSDYLPGELIISNLGFARESPADAEWAMRTMVGRDLAALAIRNVHGLPIPATVVEASRASGTPLLIYEGEYYERIIFQALSLLKRDRADSDVAQIFDGLVKGSSPEGIRAAFYDAIQATGATVQCAMLRPRAGDEASLYAQIDELSSVCEAIRRDWERVETATVLRYHGCALMLVTYHRPPAAWALERDSEFMQLLQPYRRVAAGISEEVALGQGDLAVREASAALEHACATERPIVRWAAMGAEAFRLAAGADRLIASTCDIYRQTLAKHDAPCDSSLLETAQALADACGDVRTAAEALFTHPNTVRYRMRKMREVLDMADATDRELTRFLMLVFLA